MKSFWFVLCTIALLATFGLHGQAQTNREVLQGYCEKGGEQVVTDGRSSTTRVQRSYTSCTVTVYVAGTTTLATLASDYAGTPKSNPFTADADGYWKFFGGAGRYDVKFSGAGITTPFTRSVLWIAPQGASGNPVCTAGQGLFYATPGSSTACLILGSGLTLDIPTSTLSSSGGAVGPGTISYLPKFATTTTLADSIARESAGTIIVAGKISQSSTVTGAGPDYGTQATLIVNPGGGTYSNPAAGVKSDAYFETGSFTSVKGVDSSTFASTNGTVSLVTGVSSALTQDQGTVSEGRGFSDSLTMSAGSTSFGLYTAYKANPPSIAGGLLVGQYIGFYNEAPASLTTIGNYSAIISSGGKVEFAKKFTADRVTLSAGMPLRLEDSTGATYAQFVLNSPAAANYTFYLPASTISGTGKVLGINGVSGTDITLDWLTPAVATTNYRGALNAVVDYGCDPTGVVAADTCLANAVADAALAGGYVVNIPAGTFKLTTTLTIPGGVTVLGDGRDKTVLSSTFAGPLVDLVQGSGAYLFKGPSLFDVTIKGSVGAANQVGLRMTDASYYFGSTVERVTIQDTGSDGLSIGNVYSSSWRDIYITNTAGFGLLYDAFNMPGNTFDSIYVGDVRASQPTAYRVKRGNFSCTNCNGINNVVAASKWIVVGRKNGVDGDLVNDGAVFSCRDCNLETWVGYGVLSYANSLINLLGNTTIAVDATGVGSGIPLFFDLTSSEGSAFYATQIARGVIEDSVNIQQALTSYANNQAIHSTGFAPIETMGVGPDLVSGNFLETYYNSTTASSQTLSRKDQNLSRTTIVGSTNFPKPGVRYIETNCAAPCTVTLPWPGDYLVGQTVVVKDISNNAATNNVTITANSGGTVNGSTYVIATNGQAVTLVPNNTTLDWRLVGGTSTTPSLTSTYVGFGSGGNTLTGTTKLTWDDTNRQLLIGESGNSAISTLYLRSSSSTSSVIFHSSAVRPTGTGGVIFPYIGSFGSVEGPGIYWSDGTFANTSSMFLYLGFTFQGASSSTSPLKVRKATGTNTLGALVFSLEPDSGFMDFKPYGVAAGNTSFARFSELAANGTNYVQIHAPDALAGNLDLTWFSALPGAGSECVQINSAGVLSTTGAACGGGGGSGTVNTGVAKALAYYPSNGTTVDDTVGVDWQNADPNLKITAQSATHTALYVTSAATPTVGPLQVAINGSLKSEFGPDGYLYVGKGYQSATATVGTVSGTEGTGTDKVGGYLRLQGAAGTGTGAGGSITFYTAAAGLTGSSLNPYVLMGEIDQLGNVFWGDSTALRGTSATNGFLYMNATNGTPAGTPATVLTGIVPTSIDATNYRLYAYIGGAWRNLTGSASGITIGTTAITSGTAGRILYETAANKVGEIAGSSADADGAVQFAATARTSGVAQYFRINTPADTGQTTATESVGAYFGGNGSGSTVTRTWANGAITTQRENVFVAPTYSFVSGSNTITYASTLAITGAPIQGSFATLTRSAALQFGISGSSTGMGILVNDATGAGSTNRIIDYYDSGNTNRFSLTPAGINALTSTFSITNPSSAIALTMGASSNYSLVAQQPATYTTEWLFRAVGTNIIRDQFSLRGFWSDATDATRTSILQFLSVTSAAALTEVARLGSTGFSVGTTTIGTAQAHIASISSTRVGLRVDSAATPSVDIVQFTNNGTNYWQLGSAGAVTMTSQTANTNTVATAKTINVNSTGTAAAGFGGQVVYALESTTTDSQSAAALGWLWTTATHASRTSAITLSTVDNAASLAERWRLSTNGAGTGVSTTTTGFFGGTNVTGMLSESITLNTGGTTTDSTIDLPANSIILSVTGRITTTITTATDWKLGDATVADRFSDANATLTAGTTTVGINQWKADRTTAGQGAFQQSTAKVRITTTGTPGAGVIRITIYYITLSAPTS